MWTELDHNLEMVTPAGCVQWGFSMHFGGELKQQISFSFIGFPHTGCGLGLISDSVEIRCKSTPSVFLMGLIVFWSSDVLPQQMRFVIILIVGHYQVLAKNPGHLAVVDNIGGQGLYHTWAVIERF